MKSYVKVVPFNGSGEATVEKFSEDAYTVKYVEPFKELRLNSVYDVNVIVHNQVMKGKGGSKYRAAILDAIKVYEGMSQAEPENQPQDVSV